MSFFKQVEGEAAILVNRGTYTQADIFTRDGYLYAKVGSGFVRLMADGSTSKASVYLDFLSYGGAMRQRLGRLCTADVEGGKPIDGAAAVRLLGGAQ